uniref:Short coiled-coil protein a n=1 Tax=Oryzias melastigma TaxID=30732 RepID=A0A3B3CR40_ORYME
MSIKLMRIKQLQKHLQDYILWRGDVTRPVMLSGVCLCRPLSVGGGITNFSVDLRVLNITILISKSSQIIVNLLNLKDILWTFEDGGSAALHTKQENEPFIMNCDIDGDMENQVEMEEKTRLINQVLELQHTLEDLSARVDAVKEENLKLKSENQVLGQYIENLMSASSVFQTTDTKSKRK